MIDSIKAGSTTMLAFSITAAIAELADQKRKDFFALSASSAAIKF
jgi:hypothetical protein